MSLPLTAVIAELKLTPSSIIPILQALHAENAAISLISKVDLKHLTSRSVGLLKKHEPYSMWCGANIINVLIENSVILSSEGSLFFSSLLKAWSAPEARDPKIFRSIVECLNKLCKNIRGKPTLTREVLTPNLGPLLAAYLDRMLESPELMVSSLATLIREHPTTSRPYGNKIKAKLLEVISNESFMSFPKSLRASVCSLLASLTIIEKDGPEKFWAQDVNRILSNLARTLNIYSSFLSLSEDDDLSRVLKTLEALDDTEIFSGLQIDINKPMSILSISTRIGLLFELLKGYLLLPTSFAVVVPMGSVIGILDLAFSINTRFVQFKRELRDVSAKEFVNISLERVHQSALHVLGSLPGQYSVSLIPHMSNILASLELLIFLQKNRIDGEKVLANEDLSCSIVSTTSKYLKLCSYLKDFSQISRIVDLALFLVEPRAAPSEPSSSAKNAASSTHSKSARKNAKKGGAVALADLLAHEHLFQRNVPSLTRQVVLQFLQNVIEKTPVAPTQYNKLSKFIVTDAVLHKSKSKYGIVPTEVNDVLVASLLHPGANSASIYPIANSVTNSTKLSLVQNPRFPPLPIVQRNAGPVNEDLDSQDDYLEPASKKQKIVSVITQFDAPKVSQETQTTFEAPEHLIFKEVTVNTSETKDEVVVEEMVVDAQVEVEQPQVEIAQPQLEIDEDESDGGSEIEIPELDMDSDSGDEK